MRKLILIAVLLSVAGIGQDQAQVTVHVYRARQATARLRSLPFYCDEHLVAQLKNGSYFELKLPPGSHIFRGNDRGVSLQMTLKPGEEYFIRAEQALGMWHGTQQITAVDAALAESEMRGLKLAKP